jgi:hypothetical protein
MLQVRLEERSAKRNGFLKILPLGAVLASDPCSTSGQSRRAA